MKRCPQCEFIYEDDQSLCDMDGILLVLDSQKLPKPKYPGEKPKSTWRSRVVTGLAATVLATVLMLVFYVSPNSQRPARTSYQPAGIGQPKPAETNLGSSQPTANERPVEEAPAAKSEPVNKPKPTAAPKNSPKPGQPKTTTKKSVNSVSSQNTAKKNESKLGAVMKKTGRILSKPFRL